ncbi:unnamed protein product [Chironomus riparius]|uniref:WAPL domain-containing protein n=1 Tax=Chironomus riparius TaxID=315576 RepID=A0A9N9RTJ1_9DIPT|nr:unnamed protein product [Chironomus riparius]
MSRWNKSGSNRFQQTVVPLDNLLREKENKNSVAVGTVMKFGMMQFTSIRSSCYNMGALNSTSPIQNSASSPTSPDLNDTKISVEQTPKPRKFFKSRNSGGAAEIHQQIALQQQIAIQQQNQAHNNHIQHPSSSDEQSQSPQKMNKVKKGSPKKEKKLKVEKPKVEKPIKIKKEKPPKVQKVRKQTTTETVTSEGDKSSPSKRSRAAIEATRSSNRARGKINYNEDVGEEEFIMRTEKRIAPRLLLKQQQEEQLAKEAALLSTQESFSTQEEHPEIESPTINQAPSSTEAIPSQSPIHPPIVLRISKGTSRLVSTDNEDGVKSPHLSGDNSSGDENKNVVNNNNALTSTDELIAVLSGDLAPEQPEPEQKPERIRIRIKKDYIRSYNDSLRQQEAKEKTEELQQQEHQEEQEILKEPSEISEPSSGRVTRRRGKAQEKIETAAPRISPIVSEFDSQSSVLGSVTSQATTGTSTSIMNPSQGDCKVIHSRSSSVVTSDVDTSIQSSMAAAPPSGSENFSSNNGSQDETPIVQKGRRGRKKQMPEINEIEMKPPEPIIVEKPATRTRNTRNKAQQLRAESVESITSPDVSPTKSDSSSPEKRSTRNTRNNNVNNVSQNITEASTVSIPKSRKRKNPDPQPQPPIEEIDHHNSSVSTDDQTAALNLSQRSLNTTSSTSMSDDILPPQVPEYKHKKLVKRSWEQDKPTPMDVDQVPAPTTRSSPNKQYNNNHLQKQQESNENNSNPGVKLLISKKKGSIFKSRALDKDEDNNKKRLNLYKHTWDEDAELADQANNANDKAETLSTITNSGAATTFFDGETSGISRFSRHKKTENNVKESIIDDFDEDDMPLAGMNHDRNAKDYYQVVRNVKKAHQIQEIGEFQEMDDDVEYLLDALQPNSQVALRCLSALQLASKCMTPSFRMHIRAHGIVPKFFKALEDAPNDPSLGLCTAMVMFALSQDTLKMDLDRGSLELMLNLLECEADQKQFPKDIVMNKQHIERKQKVRELCEEIQSQGKSIHLNLDNITAAQLAMESLLSLTSKRAGEWLKEDLRELGGIEHIIKTVHECCNQVTDYVEEWTELLLEKLNKIGRCLRILENVTSNSEENQKYILHYKSQVFIKTLCRFYNLLSTELTLYPTTEKSAKDFAGVAIRETLLTLLKVIVNLTHPFNERAIGSVLFGDFKEIFQISINSLLFGVTYVSSRFQFDFSLLTLVLLSNLTQLNEKNRQSIMQLSIPAEEFGKEKQPAIKSLIEFFYRCEDNAKTLKKLTDDLIDNSKKRDAKQEEAVNALIQNSGTHMENTILGSFTCTLLGFVIMNNPNNETIARRYLRDGKFETMVVVLKQYYEFLNLTVSADASSMAQLKTIKNVMDYLVNCDVD